MLLPPDHDPLTACATDAPSVTHLDDRQRILAAVRAVAATPTVVTRRDGCTEHLADGSVWVHGTLVIPPLRFSSAARDTNALHPPMVAAVMDARSAALGFAPEVRRVHRRVFVGSAHELRAQCARLKAA